MFERTKITESTPYAKGGLYGLPKKGNELADEPSKAQQINLISATQTPLKYHEPGIQFMQKNAQLIRRNTHPIGSREWQCRKGGNLLHWQLVKHILTGNI